MIHFHCVAFDLSQVETICHRQDMFESGIFLQVFLLVCERIDLEMLQKYKESS